MKKLAVGAMSLALSFGSAMAQDVIKLKLSHLLPTRHYAFVNGIKVFEDRVSALSGGKIVFEDFPSAQLGKDSLSVISSGLADVAMIVTSYAPAKFPLTSVTELPGISELSCEATNRFAKLAAPGGILAKEEYDPLGIHILFLNTLPSYNTLTIAGPVKTLDDVKGLKVFANGSAMIESVKALGMVPVQMSSKELYDSLKRGTVDGAVYPYGSMNAYKLQDSVKYALEGAKLGSASWMLAIGNKTWNALPADAKSVLTKASDEVRNSFCEYVDKEHFATRDKVAAESGLVVSKLSAEQTALWNGRLKSVATVWEKSLNDKGRPGTAVLEAFSNAK